MNELVNVLKLSVNGCEPYVGNFIDLLESVHYLFSDKGTGNLFFMNGLEGLFDLFDQIFSVLNAYWSLFTGPFESLKYLGPVKGFSAVVLLDNMRDDIFNSLVAGEAAFTLQTFTAAADDIAVFALSGINYFIVNIITKWTTHSDYSLLMVRPIPKGISFVGICETKVSLFNSAL